MVPASRAITPMLHHALHSRCGKLPPSLSRWKGFSPSKASLPVHRALFNALSPARRGETVGRLFPPGILQR